MNVISIYKRWIAVAIGACALVAIVGLSGSGLRASTGPVVSVDAEADGSNTATSLGPIDSCLSVSTGAIFQSDVVIQSVDGLTGLEASLHYDPAVLRITGVDYDFLLGLGSGGLLDLGDTVPDSDGEFKLGAVTFPLSPVTGSGVLARLTIEAVGTGFSGLYLENVKLADALGEPIQPADPVTGVYQGSVNDASVVVAAPCSDSDLDGYSDEAEAGTPLCNGVNEDWFDDDVIDDGCPGGPPQAGQFSEAEFNIGTDPLSPCSPGFDPGPSPAWPSDLVSGSVPDSTDRVNIVDLASFVVPERRLGTMPGDAAYDQRWDLSPGSGPLTAWINIIDLSSLVAGETGYPPMFGGSRAFGGPLCTE